MNGEDSFGLFGAEGFARGSGSEGPPTKKAKVEAEKRVKLWKSDTVAAQVLNPYGPSQQLQGMDTKSLWSCCAKGNKYVAFHTELASDDPLRVGIRMSRVAETLVAAITAVMTDARTKLM